MWPRENVEEKVGERFFFVDFFFSILTVFQYFFEKARQKGGGSKMGGNRDANACVTILRDCYCMAFS
jgi:hypothetical protein